VIDSHQHFWQVGRFDYPWMSRELGVLYQDYLPPALEPILRDCGVACTVTVQASNTLAETRWLLSLADEYEFIAGVVGWVDLAAPDCEQQLVELQGHARFKGVRHLVENEPAADWLVQPAVLRGLRLLSDYNLSYDLLVHTRHLEHVVTVAEHCPELRLVVDHMAKPPIAAGEIKVWQVGMSRVAACPNVFCKLSGLVTEAKHDDWRVDHLRPYVEAGFTLFGPGRMMFGSDWPVCRLAASYQQVLDSFAELLRDLSEAERKAVCGDNAASFYRL
jgi:L-fucono-1,5-lactonase